MDLTSIKAKLSTSISNSETNVKDPRSNTIKGTPRYVCKYIYNDIQALKQEIKSYNQLTNIFNNKFYYKLFKLIESSQTQELTKLQQNCNYKFDDRYYKSLVTHYKACLKEYEDFFQLIQYNFNNSLLLTSKSNPRTTSPSPEPPRVSSIDLTDLDNSIPDDLIDPLSFEIFTDPVITPSGITYERSLIVDHLFKNGQFDPVTKQLLTQNQLYPNLAIKNSVNRFIHLKSS